MQLCTRREEITQAWYDFSLRASFDDLDSKPNQVRWWAGIHSCDYLSNCTFGNWISPGFSWSLQQIHSVTKEWFDNLIPDFFFIASTALRCVI
jgi:hypothetical protein